jgi:uncharacterized protein (TIGR03437 family)
MNSSVISKSIRILLLCTVCAGLAHAQSLTMYSGNGQVVREQFLSNAPLVVQAKDAAGRPAAGVSVSWAITQGAGTLNAPTLTTDANGFASTNFLATSLQPLQSFQSETITATSNFGGVNFFITTVPEITPPSVQLINPTLDNRSITAPSGSTVPGGVVVRVIAQSGIQSGAPIPNISVRIVDAQDPTIPAQAACNAPLGTVLTDSTGTATCDLVISGPTGTEPLRAYAGEIQYTASFALNVTTGQSCSYSLSSSSQSFSGAGGQGTVNVVTSSGCGWSAASNAGFVAVTSATTGTGSSSVSYAVSANSGPARTGTLTIAGHTFTVNQSAAGGGPSPLTIPPQTLPQGAVGTSYHTALTASGGTPNYTWSPAGSISTSGLTMQATGDINGTPATAGTFTFTATVSDSAGARQSQSFSITVTSTGPPPSGFTITNTQFPSGVVGQPYPSQVLLAVGGCVTPFSPQPAFTVTNGSLPAGLSIQTNSDGSHSIAGTPSTAGSSRFTLSASDACQKTATADFTITITGSTPTSQQMQVTPASLAFTVQAGASSAPADQTITISSNSGALSYNAAVATTAGGTWLVARNAASGNTPGSFTVGVGNFASLAAGSYNGSITITSSASNSPVVIPASLTVVAATPLTASPNSFTINQIVSSGSNISRQPISLASGTTPVQFSDVATTNKGGSWLTLSGAQGTTPATLTAIIDSGGLAVGQYTGTITISPASGAAQLVTVTLNVTAPAVLSAAPAPLAFTYQQGSTAPAALALGVSSSGTPVNISVSTATQSGGPWLSVSPSAGATTVNLSVSVTPIGLAPGSYSGSVVVTPSDPTVAPLTIPVTLVISQAAPVLTATANAASYAPGPVTPGEIVTIFGSGMGPATLMSLHITDAGTVDTSLGGTQVFFDGYPAPVIYSSSTAVSVIVPYEIAGSQTTSMMIQYQGAHSNRMTFPVLASLPGIFTIDASGFGQGAILNQDTSVNSSQNGADPGSVVSIYATGGGQTDPPSADGTLATTAASTVLPVKVQIAGEDANVLYAGAAPGEPAGVIQVNARIPADVSRGTNVPVVIIVGGTSSQAGVTVAIKP